ncbi:MAG: DUF4330 domain-containing protein [Haloarculaceae archaeon]
MEVIDDEGRLFGTVNVVDALAVLLVLAVLVAGVALVFGGSDEPTETTDTDTTHVTLDLGTQPAYILTELNEGDTYSPTSNAQLTVTDVHLTPQDGATNVTLRAELEGSTTDDGIAYDDAPPRLGRTLSIVTNRYEVEGQIRAVGGGADLARTDPTVVLRATLGAQAARTLAPGDEIRVAGRTVATIDDRAVYATTDPDQRVVYLETTLAAHRQQGQPRFGGQPIRSGQPITLPGDGYTVTGTIERVGGGIERGEADVLLQDTIDIETADRLAEGDTADIAGTTTAIVEHVELYGTGDPEQKRAFVGLSLATVDYGERPQFGQTPLQAGRSVTVQTPEYTLAGPIERVGHLQPRGTATTRTVTLRMTELREEFASAIEPGMVEQVDGQQVAEITDVDVEPSTVIVTGDRGNYSVYDHPYNRDVTITAEVRVRETTTGPQFKGRPIRQQDTITLDLESLTVRGTVVRIR